MNRRIKASNTELWRGVDGIQVAFDALGIDCECTLQEYFQRAGRIVVRNDPVLAEVFGQDVIDRYEIELATVNE